MIGADVPLVVGRPRRQPRIRSSVLPYNRPTIPAHSRRIPPPYRHPRGGIVRDPAGFTRPGFGNEDGNAAATCVIYRAKLVSKRVGSVQTPPCIRCCICGAFVSEGIRQAANDERRNQRHQLWHRPPPPREGAQSTTNCEPAGGGGLEQAEGSTSETSRSVLGLNLGPGAAGRSAGDPALP